MDDDLLCGDHLLGAQLWTGAPLVHLLSDVEGRAPLVCGANASEEARRAAAATIEKDFMVVVLLVMLLLLRETGMVPLWTRMEEGELSSEKSGHGSKRAWLL